MYLECGGIADGQYYEEAWESFCNTNGWMEKGMCTAVKYDTFSARGHLPIMGLVGFDGLLPGERAGGWWLGVLDSVGLSLLSHRDL